MKDKKTSKKAPAIVGAEFTGKVNSITSTKSGAEFRFEVASRKNGSRNYQLDGANAALVSLVTAAYVSGKKITVLDATASAVRLGPKPAEPKPAKVKTEKPPKRVSGPVVEVPPAA